MNPFISYFSSSIGKKTIVAVTGVFLILFVVGHLVGNLQIFLGPEWINAYAHKLHSLGPLLWVIRLVLLAIVVTHIGTTIALVIQNKKARPQNYAVIKPKRTTLASRSMILSGLIILSFIVFHLLHFTVRAVPGHIYEDAIVLASGDERPTEVLLTKGGVPVLENGQEVITFNVYDMMVAGFSYWYITAFYLVAMFLLCMHLGHGIASTFQTLGLRNKTIANSLSAFSRVSAWIIFVGYVSIPLAVLTNIIKAS